MKSLLAKIRHINEATSLHNTSFGSPITELRYFLLCNYLDLLEESLIPNIQQDSGPLMITLLL